MTLKELQSKFKVLEPKPPSCYHVVCPYPFMGPIEALVERVPPCPAHICCNCIPLAPGTKMAAAIFINAAKIAAGTTKQSKMLDHNCANVAVSLGLGTEVSKNVV